MYKMKTKNIRLPNIGLVSDAPKQNLRHLARLARVCAVATAIATVPIHSVLAGADDQHQQILPFPTVTESTVPTNGDVNPYGVAFVPQNCPAGGLLNPGDLLVSNFNNKLNLQGTGTTIIKVAPNGQTSLFFQGTGPLGLSTGLAVLKKGLVLVANCPTTGGAAPMAEPGSLLVIDRSGHLINTIVSPLIQGPWDFTIQDDGNLVQVFISNVLTGTVSRLDLLLDDGNVLVKSAAVIASGYLHRPDPATFEVGPTGLAYDQRRDVLYVASTGDNEVFAVKNAGQENQSRGMGQLIYRDHVHLHGALAMVLAPNGHLLVSNSDGINPDQNQPSEIVEFTVQGQFVGQLSVDPAEGGAFGLNIIQATDDVVRFAAVDDNANTITLWKLNTPGLTGPQQN
jgi:DNA-binding beta-propeller fold protein YncE